MRDALHLLPPLWSNSRYRQPPPSPLSCRPRKPPRPGSSPTPTPLQLSPFSCAPPFRSDCPLGCAQNSLTSENITSRSGWGIFARQVAVDHVNADILRPLAGVVELAAEI